METRPKLGRFKKFNSTGNNGEEDKFYEFTQKTGKSVFRAKDRKGSGIYLCAEEKIRKKQWSPEDTQK
ncbi:hypothetical protein J11TS1_25890 [Oceanobacillus sp. J11TS1]|nr:hypothetical protein J11TS1_25890 [Oceanobacillus sp. J11TS1]